MVTCWHLTAYLIFLFRHCDHIGDSTQLQDIMACIPQHGTADTKALLGFILLLSSSVSSLWFPWPGSYNCHPCECELHQTDNGFSRIADCSSKGLLEIPLNLPPDLEVLDLANNRIMEQSLIQMQNYMQLRSLSFKSNRLTSFPDDVFKNCTYLQVLNLEGNHLVRSNKDLFKNVEYIQNIQGLEVDVLEVGIFESLKHLRQLSIILHQEFVPEMLFNNLQLQALSLTITTAQILPKHIFRNLHFSLNDLEISGDRLHYLYNDTFLGLPQLRRLTLNVPGLESLPANIFHRSNLNSEKDDGLPNNLNYIRIEGVKMLPSEIFHGQKTVETIVLKDINNLPQTSSLFEGLVTLNNLDLSQCRLTYIHSGWFQDLSSLKLLNLSSTQLIEITPTSFSGLLSLTHLDLSHNNLNSIEESAFNQFRFMLEYLNVSNNNLIALTPGVFKGMLSLTILNLKENKIEVLTESVFNDLQKLRHLDLSRNGLKVLSEEVFRSQNNLMTLALSNNNLSNLPNNLFHNTMMLRKLDVDMNWIRTLPDGLLNSAVFLSSLLLSNNPIRCDCQMVKLEYSKPRMHVDGFCSTPSKLNGTPIHNIHLELQDECSSEIQSIDAAISSTPPTIVIQTTSTESAKDLKIMLDLNNKTRIKETSTLTSQKKFTMTQTPITSIRNKNTILTIAINVMPSTSFVHGHNSNTIDKTTSIPKIDGDGLHKNKNRVIVISESDKHHDFNATERDLLRNLAHSIGIQIGSAVAGIVSSIALVMTFFKVMKMVRRRGSYELNQPIVNEQVNAMELEQQMTDRSDRRAVTILNEHADSANVEQCHTSLNPKI